MQPANTAAIEAVMTAIVAVDALVRESLEIVVEDPPLAGRLRVAATALASKIDQLADDLEA